MHAKTQVDLYTEIRLYDLNAITAAVGGSLGLFLGFSVLDSIILVIHNIFSICKRLTNRPKRAHKSGSKLFTCRLDSE